MHSLLLPVAPVILLPEQDYGKRTDDFTEILKSYLGVYIHDDN